MYVVAILVLAFLGIADSVYLAESKANNTPLICNIQSLSDCNIVSASQYSYIFGIPIAEFGVVFYSILFVLAALELVLFNRVLRRILQGVSIIGFVASIYFTLIQTFVINAFCIYCLASAVISLFIFICAYFIEPLRRFIDKNSPPAPPTNFQMPQAS